MCLVRITHQAHSYSHQGPEQGRSRDGLRTQFMMPVGERYAYIAHSSAISSRAVMLNRAGRGVRPYSVPGPRNAGNSSVGRTALTTFECNTSPDTKGIVKHLHNWY
jgi:hypothetical protein